MQDFVKVANASDIQASTVKIYDVANVRIAICNVAGSYYAIKDVCTHDDGPLGEGDLEGCQIECPRHGARFDVTTGKAMCLPAVLPVPTYPVEVRGTDIFVAVSGK